MSGWKRAVAAFSVIVGIGLAGCNLLKPSTPAKPKTGAESFGLADADVVVLVSPAAILSSKALKGFISEIEKLGVVPPEMLAKPPAELIKDATGIDPLSFESVIVSVKPTEEKFVAVAVSKVAIDSKSFLATIGEKAGEELKEVDSHEGVALYGTGQADEPVLAFPSSKLVAMGMIPELKKCIADFKAGRDAGKGSAYDLLASAPEGSDLIVAVPVTPDLAKAMPMSPMPGMDLAAELDKIESIVVALDAGEAFDITTLQIMKDAAAGAKARKEAQDQIAGAAANPMLAAFKGFLDSIEIGGAGKTVEVKVSIDPSIVKAVGPMIPMIQMMLGGGMSGGKPPGPMPGMPGMPEGPGF